MNLTSPESLIFWTSLVFIVFFILMKKVAWNPILGAVKSREDSINNALLAAENAKKDMLNLKADNEKLLAEARAERDTMIKEAREIKEKMMEQAKASIANEKNAAIADLKNQVGTLSLEIAEKVLKGELSNRDTQTKLVEQMLGDAKLN